MAEKIQSRLLLGEPNNSLFKNNTGTNPDFRKIKYNNIIAFKSMYIISLFNGDINDPKFPEEFKKVILDGSMFKSVPNGEVLVTKLKQFLNAWPQIKDDPQLGVDVPGVLATFHTSWQEYDNARSIYTDRENVPLYFDVSEYLNTILDNNGKIKPYDKNKQDDYLRLASDWRKELNEQQRDYTRSKNNEEAE